MEITVRELEKKCGIRRGTIDDIRFEPEGVITVFTKKDLSPDNINKLKIVVSEEYANRQ